MISTWVQQYKGKCVRIYQSTDSLSATHPAGFEPTLSAMALHLFYLSKLTLPLSHRFVSISQKECNSHKDHSKMCGFHALKWRAEARNLCRKAQKQNKSYNHCPCPSPAHVGKSWPLPWLQVLQYSGSQMLMLDLKLHQNKISSGFSTGAVWGVRLRPSVSSGQWAIVLQFRKNNGQALLWLLLWGSTTAIITPMQKASTCGLV